MESSDCPRKSGYYVQYSTNKRFKKNTKTLKIKTTWQNSATITKLKKRKHTTYVFEDIISMEKVIGARQLR